MTTPPTDRKRRLYSALSCHGTDLVEAAGALRHARYPHLIVENAEHAVERIAAALAEYRAGQKEKAA